MSNPNYPAALNTAVPLTPTATQTASLTAAVNTLVPVDATNSAITVTLPTAPADKSRITVKKIDSSTNIVTIVAGGSDVFNKAGGSTSTALTVANQSTTIQYAATPAIWYVVSSDTPLTSLDSRYTTTANVASAIATQATVDAGQLPLN